MDLEDGEEANGRFGAGIGSTLWERWLSDDIFDDCKFIRILMIYVNM